MRLTIAWKIFLAFCVVLLVVMSLGLWSLQATRRLHELNQTLLDHAIPAVRLQLVLEQQIPTLVRNETRAIIFKDPGFQALHRQGTQAFRSGLHGLAGYVEGRQAESALEQVRVRFSDYVGLVERAWAALGRNAPDEAIRLSEGPTRQATETLKTAVEALLAQSRVDLERKVAAAGGLERTAHTATLVSLAVSLAVGLGLATMVAIRIARPIRALSQATQLVARGEYDLPVIVASRDEVGDLARAFRDMAQKLREVDTLKDELFSNISHDIRSPLTSIQMAARLVATEPVGPKQARWLEIIQGDSDKLLYLTNQILDLSKLRSGMLRLDVSLANIRRIADSAVQELRPVADQKGVVLIAALPDPGPQLVCDAGRIQQVFANLLSNAVKFTPKGGQVLLTVKEEGDEILITVADTGVGIPAEQLPHVFERFHQAHAGKGGTGLGLAIVKGFVEAHRGRVWAESREGEGTRFHVTLPRTGGQG